MTLYNSIDKRKADTIAFIGIGIFSPIEWFEKVWQIFFGDTDAMVLELEHHFTRAAFQQNRDTIINRILTTIVEDVDDGSFQQLFITVYIQARLIVDGRIHLYRDLVFRVKFLEL